MKKLISLILILCMACMLIPAMAEDVTGEWYGSMMGTGIIMTFNEDGTFSMTAGGNAMGEGTWKVEDGKLIADVAGDAETFEIKDGTLYEPNSDITLTRNPEDAPAAVVIADVKADAAAEEFYGEWACSAVEVSGMTLSADSYAEAAQGDTLPGLVISDSAITFTGDGMFASLFSMFTLTPAYEDGAIIAKGELSLGGESSSIMDVQLQILEDGSLKATLDNNGSPMVLYFVPAAAAEAPAA